MLALRYLLLFLSGLEAYFHLSPALASQEMHNLEKRSASFQQGNAGNEFYIAFMDNYVKAAFQNIPGLIINRSTIFITTTDPSGAVTMIESEQGISTHSVSAGGTLSKPVQRFKVQSVRDRNKGLKIKAEQSKQILVFALNEELHSVEGFTALPCTHLPSVSVYEYYAVSVPPTTTQRSTADSAFLIVACSNDTTISVTPVQTVDHPSTPGSRVSAGDTFNITLQERETLYVQSRLDLSGSRVQSTAPISFFTGHECGNVPADIAECDHLVEQIPPTVTWGQQFIIAPTATRTAEDIIKVIVSEDDTEGKVSCVDSDGNEERFNLTFSSAGSFIELRLPSNTYCFLEANKPVLVVQFTPGGRADGVDNGDPFMVLVPAVSQYLENTTFSTVSGLGLFFNNYANVFVPAGPNSFNPSTIIMDGAPITADNWVAIPCFDGRTCAHAAQVVISDGVHSIWNSDGGSSLGVTVYGLSYLETYAYVGGLKLSLPGLDLDPTPSSYFILSGGSICMPCLHSGGERVRYVAEFRWSKDEVLLLEVERVRIINDGFLCIDNATVEDAGNYSCIMSGVAYPSQLSVIGGIIVEPPTCASSDRGTLVGIGQRTVYLDSSTEAVQVCCTVQGPPDTMVSWLQDGTPIKSGTKGYEIVDKLGEGYMRYSGPMRPGCVTFTCQANFTLDLPVAIESSEICFGSISAPTVVNITGSTNVPEHSSVSYQCSADGFPAPTKMWTAYRERKNPLPSNARDHGNGTLTISNVTETDGTLKYCCDVNNTHGILCNCISINVLIPPELVQSAPSPIVIVSVPFSSTLPLETPVNTTITIGQSIMIPESYNLHIECRVHRGNPEPSISWLHSNESILGPQFTVQRDGSLVLEDIVRDRDDGVYTCIADTPNVGRDESSSNVNVTVPPRINSSGTANSPGNCLDLTHEYKASQQVGLELCVRAGPGATLTLQCEVVEGLPQPEVKWLKDGEELAAALDGSYSEGQFNLTLTLPTEASYMGKRQMEGNYTCIAINVAGMASASSYVTLFGDISAETARTEFVRKQSDIYLQLHRTVTEHFPEVQDGDEHLVFFTSGRVLSYNDFDPGYLYDGSEESILPQTMENMFDMVDLIPTGGSIVFNPHESERLRETYGELVEQLQVTPSSLSPDEQRSMRQYLQQQIRDPGSDNSLPRLSLYLLYKNTYYMTKIEVENTIDAQRQQLPGWEFSQWYERNIHNLQMRINDAYMKWEMYADKTEVEEKLSTFNLEDHSQDINVARVLLLANQRKSRFKDEKEYYLVKLFPDTWYKGLKNRVKESIQQMQFRLTQLKTEIQILEITSQYLEKEARKRDVLNALFPSLDPIYRLYCDLDVATYQLEEIVKDTEHQRYNCIVTGNPADCHLYWDLYDYVRNQVMENYTEFYWYVHTVQAALNHQEVSIPAIASTINSIQVHVDSIQSSISIALSELADRDAEEDADDRDFLSDFVYRQPNGAISIYDFELPPSLIGRLLWYINPESTRLLLKEVLKEYNLTFNHLNTAFTNVSAKLMKVNVYRRWFKSGLFGNKHLNLEIPGVMVSPGRIHPPEDFREMVKNGTYRLPLYPSSLLLATDIQLTVDVPFVFHTLPTLIKLSYDPHISGGFGPFSFGPLHRANAGNMKFRVGIRDSKITVTIPGTQLIGFVCDVVPQHPRETVNRSQRSTRSVNYHREVHAAESEFDQWLFSKKDKEPARQDGLFRKNSRTSDSQVPAPNPPLDGGGVVDGRERAEDTTESLAALITPTVPLHSMHTDELDISAYSNVSSWRDGSSSP